MILVYILIVLSLITSTFFTCFSIFSIVCGWFGYHMDLNLPFLEDKYWEDKKIRVVAKMHSMLAAKENKKESKSNIESSTSNDNLKKFNIAIDDPSVIIKPTTDLNGMDLASLIEDGANIDIDDLNKKLIMLETN